MRNEVDSCEAQQAEVVCPVYISHRTMVCCVILRRQYRFLGLHRAKHFGCAE